MVKGFKNITKDVPISLEDLEREYCRSTGQDYPIKDMIFVRSWMLFRVRLFAGKFTRYWLSFFQLAVISQGIAARYARRQASSEVAFIQVKMFPVIGMLAKAVLEDEGFKIDKKSMLWGTSCADMYYNIYNATYQT